MAGGKTKDAHYLDTNFLKSMMEARGLSVHQVERDLQWGQGTLAAYMTWKSLTPSSKAKQIAKYFGGYPSTYYKQKPNQAMIKAHQAELDRLEAYRNKAKNEKQANSSDQSIQIPQATSPTAQAVSTAHSADYGTDLKMIKELLIQINQRDAEMEKKIDQLQKAIDEDRISRNENDLKRQTYLVTLLKDIKKDIKRTPKRSF